MFESLDVGCGYRPKGHVNVDLHTKDNPETYALYRDVRDIPNFIQADGRYLPLRDDVFDVVFSREAIEHVDKPYLFLSELLRVSHNKVVLTTPHRFTKRMNPFHQHHFTIKWFDKALRKLGIRRENFQLQIIKYSYLPHRYIPLVRLPRNILVEVRKKNPFWKEMP